MNLDDKNCALVGLGSYLVNMGNCNDCHDTGPAAQFVRGGNDIISRNLTPSTKTGLAEGDHTFEEFLKILRTGKDFDNLHPNCSATVTKDCFPTNPPNPPFNGDRLQIMPWPNYQEMTDHDIRAIYEYLRAIPCIRGNYPGPGVQGNFPAEPADRCQ